ncbi:hypothetical protein HK105_204645 [Polyrhizophydium stewartii]|uniref:BZIP domain-containing protein n=1 Tax=Polyrhizophydium stewartii TaxID=2732419 RepID=A0ABR4N847_9FUNG|nr:hypothetical protein HK105_000828 [Polyrhizophydium stewartii]
MAGLPSDTDFFLWYAQMVGPDDKLEPEGVHAYLQHDTSMWSPPWSTVVVPTTSGSASWCVEDLQAALPQIQQQQQQLPVMSTKHHQGHEHEEHRPPAQQRNASLDDLIPQMGLWGTLSHGAGETHVLAHTSGPKLTSAPVSTPASAAVASTTTTHSFAADQPLQRPPSFGGTPAATAAAAAAAAAASIASTFSGIPAISAASEAPAPSVASQVHFTFALTSTPSSSPSSSSSSGARPTPAPVQPMPQTGPFARTVLNAAAGAASATPAVTPSLIDRLVPSAAVGGSTSNNNGSNSTSPGTAAAAPGVGARGNVLTASAAMTALVPAPAPASSVLAAVAHDLVRGLPLAGAAGSAGPLTAAASAPISASAAAAAAALADTAALLASPTSAIFGGASTTAARSQNTSPSTLVSSLRSTPAVTPLKTKSTTAQHGSRPRVAKIRRDDAAAATTTAAAAAATAFGPGPSSAPASASSSTGSLDPSTPVWPAASDAQPKQGKPGTKTPARPGQPSSMQGQQQEQRGQQQEQQEPQPQQQPPQQPQQKQSNKREASGDLKGVQDSGATSSSGGAAGASAGSASAGKPRALSSLQAAKRAKQNREAQRNFRQRHKLYVQNLESTVLRLQAQLSAIAEADPGIVAATSHLDPSVFDDMSTPMASHGGMVVSAPASSMPSPETAAASLGLGGSGSVPTPMMEDHSPSIATHEMHQAHARARQHQHHLQHHPQQHSLQHIHAQKQGRGLVSVLPMDQVVEMKAMWESERSLWMRERSHVRKVVSRLCWEAIVSDQAATSKASALAASITAVTGGDVNMTAASSMHLPMAMPAGGTGLRMEWPMQMGMTPHSMVRTSTYPTAGMGVTAVSTPAHYTTPAPATSVAPTPASTTQAAAAAAALTGMATMGPGHHLDSLMSASDTSIEQPLTPAHAAIGRIQAAAAAAAAAPRFTRHASFEYFPIIKQQSQPAGQSQAPMPMHIRGVGHAQHQTGVMGMPMHSPVIMPMPGAIPMPLQMHRGRQPRAMFETDTHDFDINMGVQDASMSGSSPADMAPAFGGPAAGTYVFSMPMASMAGAASKSSMPDASASLGDHSGQNDASECRLLASRILGHMNEIMDHYDQLRGSLE